jgi:hypothetical protein
MMRVPPTSFHKRLPKGVVIIFGHHSPHAIFHSHPPILRIIRIQKELLGVKGDFGQVAAGVITVSSSMTGGGLSSKS